MTRTLKSAYSRTRVQTKIPKDAKTQAIQSEAKHSDINHIVSKAYQTGQLPILMNRQPVPQLPNVNSYQDAMNKVVEANQAFERLPASVRNAFENKPEKMLSAIEASKKDKNLKSELQNLGILNPDLTPSTPPAEQAAQAAPAAVDNGSAATE